MTDGGNEKAVQEKKQSSAPTRSVGRPRRLTVDAIVEAACELGIANLDMAMIAERLNTGVATLYGYVRGRDHLLELVVERMVQGAELNDRGQSWQEIIREHAALAYALFQSQPQLITNLMVHKTDATLLEYWQRIFAMLSNRNLPDDKAMALYVETNQAVIGAAVCQVRRKAFEADHEGDGPIPLIPPGLGEYKAMLERIILAYEVEFADIAPAPQQSRFAG